MTQSFIERARQIRDDLDREDPGRQRASPPADLFDVPTSRNGHGLGYARSAMERETQAVRGAAPGTRNDLLNQAAFSLGQLVAGGELAEHDVVEALTDAARSAGLDDREIASTIRSGLTKGGQQPRGTPARGDTNERQVNETPVSSSNAGETGSETGETESLLDQLRAALVDSAGLDDIPEPDPLIGDVLYRDSIAWLIGPPGNGKSFVALDMAGCVATGEVWQGNRTTQGAALYLIAEGLTGIRQRVRAWESSMGAPMAGVQFLPIAVQATNPDAWQAFVQLCAEIKPSLIVVDTQARVTVGMEENSAKDMGEFVHRVEKLRAASRACVLVVHHQGRSGDHMRGSTALEGAATTIIKVAKDDDMLTVECMKQKDAPEFDTVRLRLVSHGPSAVLSITDGEARQNVDTPAVRRMLTEWWGAHEGDWVSVSTIVDSQIATKALFHRVKKTLERSGLLEARGDGVTRRYRLRRRPDPP